MIRNKRPWTSLLWFPFGFPKKVVRSSTILYIPMGEVVHPNFLGHLDLGHWYSCRKWQVWGSGTDLRTWKLVIISYSFIQVDVLDFIKMVLSNSSQKSIGIIWILHMDAGTGTGTVPPWFTKRALSRLLLWKICGWWDDLEETSLFGVFLHHGFLYPLVI